MIYRQCIVSSACYFGAPETLLGQGCIAPAAQLIVEVRSRTCPRHDGEDVSVGTQQV
jgi:hypothetical protein